MKRQISNLINSGLNPIGLQLDRFRDPVDPGNSYMSDERMRESLVVQLAGLAMEELASVFKSGKTTEESMKDDVRVFLELFKECPIGQNSGGSGFHNLFWIYMSARVCRPDLIVESGIWRGKATWFLERACPDAEIHAFDINLGYIDKRNYKRVKFVESDWWSYGVSVEQGQSALAFFDCHISHMLRISQAHERGFTRVLLDDDLPVEKLYVDGSPPVPTANMIVNGYSGDSKIECVHRGNIMNLDLGTKGDRETLASLVDTYRTFASVAELSGYGGYTRLSALTLL
ncbi:MAG: hypothetical protein KDN22_26795 [Verrucomicrobiae bacterium]|nr:hypothetical protein [Verrucomicrobiae bacterium]